MHVHVLKAETGKSKKVKKAGEGKGAKKAGKKARSLIKKKHHKAESSKLESQISRSISEFMNGRDE